MRRRWVATLVLALLIAGAALAYRRASPGEQQTPAPVPIGLEATVPPHSSATGWRPVPAPRPSGAPRVISLVDDPDARARACGAWDAGATAKDGWAERECVARFALGERSISAAGTGIYITKMRWELAANSYGVPKSPGPPTDTWVIIVRFGYPDDSSVSVILDDGTGAPYLRIDNT